MDQDIIISYGSFYLMRVRGEELQLCHVKSDPNQHRPDLRSLWQAKRRTSPSWRDMRINIRRITAWTFKEGSADSYSSLMIYTGKRSRCWDVSEEMLKPVRALMMEIAADRYQAMEEPEHHPLRYTVLSAIIYGLTILLIALFFVKDKSPVLEKWLWIFALLIPPYCCALYHLFPDEVTDTNDRKGGLYRAPVWLPVLLATVLLSAGGIGYGIINWVRWLLIGGALTLPVMLWFAWEEQRTLRRASAILACLMLLYAFGAPLTINRRFDMGEPEQTRGRIESMYENRSRRGGRKTYFIVTLDGRQEAHYPVPNAMYESAEAGDEVLLLTYPGLLGIEYEKLELAE